MDGKPRALIQNHGQICQQLLEGGGLPGEAGAAVRQLHVHILEQIDQFVVELRLPSRGTDGEELLPFVTIRDSWANINPRGR